MPSPQGRLWIIVWNNYPEDWQEWWAALSVQPNVQWLGGVPEVGEQGTPHIQGNIYLHRKASHTTVVALVQNFCYGAHIGDEYGRRCFGNFGQNCSYITKTGADVYEFGTRPPMSADGGEGDRWKAVRSLAKDGDFDTIEEEYFDIWLRYESKLRKLFKVPPLEQACEVIWIYGPPRAGKDRYVRYELAPDAYVHSCTHWFDEYCNEEDVYFPDMDPDIVAKLGAHYFKNLCDRHVMRAEIKGSMIQIRPRRIIFTSNYTPEQCFLRLRHEDFDAMMARITLRLQMPTTPQ